MPKALLSASRFLPRFIDSKEPLESCSQISEMPLPPRESEVAIKVLPEAFAGDAVRMARFQREAIRQVARH